MYSGRISRRPYPSQNLRRRYYPRNTRWSRSHTLIPQQVAVHSRGSNASLNNFIGVLSDAKAIGETVKRLSPETLVGLAWKCFAISLTDAISIGCFGRRVLCRERRVANGCMGYRYCNFSQPEGSGYPPRSEYHMCQREGNQGNHTLILYLEIGVSSSGIKVFESRKTPVPSYYASWTKYVYAYSRMYIT